jgi:hypothetical protein
MVDENFPTLYRTTRNKPSTKLPMRRQCSDVNAGFHVLLIGWRGDWADL